MKKLFKKLIAVSLCLTICLVSFTGCSGSNVSLELTIDGSTFNFKSTVQDLYDAGFVLCDTAHGGIIQESDLPKLEAKRVYTTSFYYVGRPLYDSTYIADFTGVVIQVYNPTSKDCSIKDASIFKYAYQYEEGDESAIEVLFNGENFAGLSHEEGVAAMERIGVSFKEDEKQEFLDKATNDGYSWSLLTGSSYHNYFISREKDANGDLYVDEIYFERKLDVEYK